MVGEQAVKTLADVAVTAKRQVNVAAILLGVKATVQTLAGAAAFSDLVGTKTAGLLLLIISAMDTGYATYLTTANRKNVGSP